MEHDHNEMIDEALEELGRLSKKRLSEMRPQEHERAIQLLFLMEMRELRRALQP